MASNSKQDAKILELIAEVNRRKEEIERIDRPNWRTNMSFSYDESSLNQSINLHVVSDVQVLVKIASFLVVRKDAYVDVAASFDLAEVPNFTWQGFPVQDWIADIELRIDKIQIGAKRKKLEALEASLEAIITPELRRQMELERIAKELA